MFENGFVMLLEKRSMRSSSAEGGGDCLVPWSFLTALRNFGRLATKIREFQPFFLKKTNRVNTSCWFDIFCTIEQDHPYLPLSSLLSSSLRRSNEHKENQFVSPRIEKQKSKGFLLQLHRRHISFRHRSARNFLWWLSNANQWKKTCFSFACKRTCYFFVERLVFAQILAFESVNFLEKFRFDFVMFSLKISQGVDSTNHFGW